MKTHQMPLREALALCRERRPCIDPNLGFMQELERLDEELVMTYVSCLYSYDK
jgi:hypothetical protein